jgi:hypothetical protein
MARKDRKWYDIKKAGEKGGKEGGRDGGDGLFIAHRKPAHRIALIRIKMAQRFRLSGGRECLTAFPERPVCFGIPGPTGEKAGRARPYDSLRPVW